MDFSHTAHYHYLDIALAESAEEFFRLQQEMKAFKPRPATDFHAAAAKRREEYKKLNPTMSDASLDQWVDGEVAMESLEKNQFLLAFNNRFMSKSVTITLLSHALCEAAINAIIAIGLAFHKNEDVFQLIEKCEMKEKWTDGPKLFFPAYNLPKDGQLYETLTILNRRRNNLVHYKITLESKGEVVIEGTKVERVEFSKEATWMKRFSELPYELHRHACSQIREPSIHGVLSRTWNLQKG